MKRFERILLAVLLIVSLTITASVAIATTDEPTITVETIAVMPGDTATVGIYLENNPGVTSVRIQVNYDDQALKLTEIKYNIEEMGGQAVYPQNLESAGSPVTLYWADNFKDYTGDCMFAELSFTVTGQAEAGQSFDVSVTYNADDIFDVEENNVAFKTVSGKITVIDCIAGDINGDRVVNTKDATRLMRYFANWDVEVNEPTLDVNGDGVCNTKDTTRLMRYLANWDVEIFCKCFSVKCTHEMTATAEKAATCTEDGNIAYWYCTSCKKYFADAQGKTETTLAATVIPATGHGILSATPAKDATCTEPGNIAYWYCGTCNKYFKDADGTVETPLAETVVSTIPHTEVIDPEVKPTYTTTGLTQGSHCGVCNTVIKAQEIVPVLQATYHRVFYGNLQGAESPTVTQFAEHSGLVFETSVPDPIREGYEFLGWYTSSEGGTKVDMIQPGTTTDVYVWAHWNRIEFEIKYKNAAKNSNPPTYTVEDEITLTNPEWAGLEFSHWTDKDGNEVTKIEKGTTGKIELEANWRYSKNLAVSNPNKYTYVGGVMDSKSRYYFIYDIGTIENIVLDEIYGTKYECNTNFSYEERETYKVQQQEARTAAQTIANSVIKSQAWENTSNWVSTHYEGSEYGAKYCPEIEIEGVKAKVYEFSAGWSEYDEDTYTETNIQMDSEVNGSEITNQTVSSISFLTENETAKTVKMELSKDVSPAGYYSYVRAADVKVFAIVTYDPANGEYYLDIYSMVYRVFDTTLFELTGDEQYAVNIESRDQLDFEIPYAQIPDKFFTVEYNANGGNGQMMKSVHEIGMSSKLLSNNFTRTGYTFGGWKTTAGDSAAIYPDASDVRDIATAGQTVTLYAHWIKNTYTIKYNANKPSNATGSVQGVPQNTHCTYDSAVTLGSAPSLIGWTFDGWYLSANGADKVGNGGQTLTNANLTAKPNDEVPLYARWTPNSIKVIYDANGGTCTTAYQMKDFDSDYGTMPTPKRTGHIFLGWYLDSKEVENSTNVLTPQEHTLTAYWLKYAETITIGNGKTDRHWIHWKTSGSNQGRTDGKDTIIPGFEKQKLEALEYTKIKVKMTFWYRVDDWGDQLILIHSNTDEEVKRFEYEWKERGWTEGTIEFEVPFSKLDGSGGFWIEWDLFENGTGADTWFVGGTTLVITAEK